MDVFKDLLHIYRVLRYLIGVSFSLDILSRWDSEGMANIASTEAVILIFIGLIYSCVCHFFLLKEEVVRHLMY